MAFDAHEALLRAGAVQPCPRHHDVYIRTHDPDAENGVYAIWTSMLKRSDGGLRQRADLMDHLASELAATPETCFICEAAYERDDD